VANSSWESLSSTAKGRAALAQALVLLQFVMAGWWRPGITVLRLVLLTALTLGAIFLMEAAVVRFMLSLISLRGRLEQERP